MEVLKEQLLAHKLILPNEFFDLCGEYAQTLLAWNKVHNLSGANTLEELRHHLFDSVYPLVFLEDFASCMDIGSGAGLPGLVLSFAKQNSEFTLVEPLQKRASFLQFVASNLGLKNVVVENRRVEQIAPKVQNLIISRAVSDAKTLYDLSLPFMDSDSILLLYKGKNTANEAKQIGATKIETNHATYLLARR